MLDNPTDIVALAQEAERREEIERSAADKFGEDFKKVVATEEGRRVLCWLLGQAGVFRLSYAGEAESTFFREGQRNIGLAVVAQIEAHTPDRFIDILRAEDDARVSSD